MTNRNSSILRYSAVGLIAFAAISRFLPNHPYNFTAIGAMALFAGTAFSDKRMAYLLPIFVMALTDLYFGFHFSILPVYMCFAITVFLGTRIKEIKLRSVIGMSLLSSFLFFLITNLPFWYADLSLYTLDLKGTLESYYMALPFFRNQLLGDLFYNGILFGIYYLICKSALKIKTQKV